MSDHKHAYGLLVVQVISFIGQSLSQLTLQYARERAHVSVWLTLILSG